MSKPFVVPLRALRPTQVAIGARAVTAKREKISGRIRKGKRLDHYLEGKPIPAVHGPGNAYFIVDHHHLSLALWQNEVENAFVQVIDDLSDLPPARFWSRMIALGRAYPFDETGMKVAPYNIPTALPALRADPFRDLAWSVREEGGFKKSREPFAEFLWAQFFRGHISRRAVVRDYDRAVERAMALTRLDLAAHLPGYRC